MANTLTQEFAAGTIRKEYIARCRGQFPKEELACEVPLLTIDRQMGLNVVHPEGKPAKTIFKRMHYDANTDTSVVHCKPLTGRSHQIRVHLQYLGHPVANDPIYSETKIWGERLGDGGIDLTPSEERAAPAPPEQLGFDPSQNPESLSRYHTPNGLNGNIQGPSSESTLQTDRLDANVEESGGNPKVDEQTTIKVARPKLLPRETGHDIGMGSPVPLSAEMVGIITRLRNMKDEDEDWSRWRDVVFRAKGALSPYGVKVPLPPQNQRKRGGPTDLSNMIDKNPHTDPSPDGVEPPQLTPEEAFAKLAAFRVPPPGPVLVPQSSASAASATTAPIATSATDSDSATPSPVQDMAKGALYCSECYLPLHPDPKPERLYIFLHALRYTTSLGSFETEIPEWAAKGWTWEQ